MVSIETEIELLLNILNTIEDDDEYASIARQILRFNEDLKMVEADRHKRKGLTFVHVDID